MIWPKKQMTDDELAGRLVSLFWDTLRAERASELAAAAATCSLLARTLTDGISSGRIPRDNAKKLIDGVWPLTEKFLESAPAQEAAAREAATADVADQCIAAIKRGR